MKDAPPPDTLAFAVCKLLIAVAWADGRLDNAEINALKDVLFTLPDLTAREWAQLEIYMDSPVREQEIEPLLDAVLERIHSEADKRFVMDTLQRVSAADGSVSPEEKRLLEHIRAGIEGKATGLAGLLARFGKHLAARKSRARTRETELEDFIQNRVLYDAERSQALAGMPRDRLRKLCAAAAMLGRVAYTDRQFDPEERDEIRNILETALQLSPDEAQLIVDFVERRVAEDLHYEYLARAFYEATTPAERTEFLKLLFRVANAAGKTSLKEIEEVRLIARELKLPHADFIEAKLTIPREDRHGL